MCSLYFNTILSFNSRNICYLNTIFINYFKLLTANIAISKKYISWTNAFCIWLENITFNSVQ